MCRSYDGEAAANHVVTQRELKNEPFGSRRRRGGGSLGRTAPKSGAGSLAVSARSVTGPSVATVVGRQGSPVEIPEEGAGVDGRPLRLRGGWGSAWITGRCGPPVAVTALRAAAAQGPRRSRPV